MDIKQSGFTYRACGPFTKKKKEFKNLKKMEIQTIFTQMSLISLAFKMIWLMEILKIWLKEQLLIKF